MVMPGEVWFGQRAGRHPAGLVRGRHPVAPAGGAGGMCHFMLPERGAGARERASAALDGRYGDEALALLLAGGPAYRLCAGRMRGQAVRRRRMFASTHAAAATRCRCICATSSRRLARQHGLRVVAQHLGGQGYRQLRLDLPSGDVWMRFSLRGAG
jgi:chemotaxis protein CheD